MNLTNRRQFAFISRSTIGAVSFLVALTVVYSYRLPFDRDLAVNLPAASFAEHDLQNILGGEQSANAVVDVATKVYNYFIYDTVGYSREAIPTEWKKTFHANIGQCDTSARLFIKLLNDTHEVTDVEFKQFNIIAVQDKTEPYFKNPGRSLIGHTIAAMESGRGSLGVDLTFGFLILTPRTKFDERVFQTRDYKIYRLYDHPSGDWDGTYNGIGVGTYRLMENRDSSASFNGDDLRATSQTFPLNDKLTEIGRIDGSSSDIAAKYGAWLDHVGYYYTPGEHVWNFHAPADGMYKVTFLFAPPANVGFDTDKMIPHLDLTAIGSAELVSPHPSENIAVKGDHLSVLVKAEKGNFGVSLGAQKPGARRIDAITIIDEGNTAVSSSD